MESKAASTKDKAHTEASSKTASDDIHEIFKTPKPTKKQKVKAAIIIQKNFRGWLQRHYYAMAKKKALRRSTCFKMFLDRYREHCQEIMKRHNEENANIYIDFFHVNAYIDNVLRFEVTFQTMVKQDQGLPFKEFRNYYTKCKLNPSAGEMQDAAAAICQDDGATINERLFSKHEVVDVSFHIYVPKGTEGFIKKVVKKSTWLHPIVDGKEASNVKLSKTDLRKTKLARSLAVVCDAKEKREERKVELIDKYTGQEAGKLGASFHIQPRSSKSTGSVRKSKPSHKRA